MNKTIGIIIGVVVVVVIVGVVSFSTDTDNTMMDKETEKTLNMNNENKDTMKQDVVDTMNKKDDGMMKSGSYEVYAPEKLMRADTGDVVLFFHASWCPSCRGLNVDIEKNLEMIPVGVSILKVDYDTESELKKKYDITYQHTLVQVDAMGTMIKKWSGSPTLDSVISNIN